MSKEKGEYKRDNIKQKATNNTSSKEKDKNKIKENGIAIKINVQEVQNKLDEDVVIMSCNSSKNLNLPIIDLKFSDSCFAALLDTGQIYAVKDIPSQVSQKGVLVAATFVDLKREAIPFRVLNLDNKPKTVDKGAVIVTCEPVVDIVARPQEFSESLRLPSILKGLMKNSEQQ
ncbi:hypothetical protein AVEN_178774-1 [Araneus ventricosus]|uniref:Uncharacterized protein n=1 Tax=Araneus ventricosus TaxID=182803 RepID=A0A4Y2NAV5_ARAVE|nr:hypothetical protein AVEN_178774-1 [Araneus ventricosus]